MPSVQAHVLALDNDASRVSQPIDNAHIFNARCIVGERKSHKTTYLVGNKGTSRIFLCYLIFAPPVPVVLQREASADGARMQLSSQVLLDICGTCKACVCPNLEMI